MMDVELRARQKEMSSKLIFDMRLEIYGQFNASQSAFFLDPKNEERLLNLLACLNGAMLVASLKTKSELTKLAVELVKTDDIDLQCDATMKAVSAVITSMANDLEDTLSAKIN